jgi:hypothetical protein
VKASITATTGGLAVDDQMRAVRRSGSSSPLAQSTTKLDDYRSAPIPGLYVAGADIGNASHVGYMGLLGLALVSGRIAGVGSARGGQMV